MVNFLKKNKNTNKFIDKEFGINLEEEEMNPFTFLK